MLPVPGTFYLYFQVPIVLVPGTVLITVTSGTVPGTVLPLGMEDAFLISTHIGMGTEVISLGLEKVHG